MSDRKNAAMVVWNDWQKAPTFHLDDDAVIKLANINKLPEVFLHPDFVGQELELLQRMDTMPPQLQPSLQLARAAIVARVKPDAQITMPSMPEALQTPVPSPTPAQK